jgi:hypothetical protein
MNIVMDVITAGFPSPETQIRSRAWRPAFRCRKISTVGNVDFEDGAPIFRSQLEQRTDFRVYPGKLILIRKRTTYMHHALLTTLDLLVRVLDSRCDSTTRTTYDDS